MNEADRYESSSAAAVTKAAFGCFALLCSTGSIGAQPVTADAERLPDAVAQSLALDGSRRVAKEFDTPRSERPKYVLFDDPSVLAGWTNGVVRWRYNDAGRNASLSGAGSAAATIATIQTAQAKWSAACSVTFIYEGTTTSVPTPQNMLAGDGISAVGWTLLSGNTTGVAGVAYSGASLPLLIVEGDIHFNNNAGFNYSLDVTALHETGHLLGIDHSDVQNVVMSGPPLTSYVSLNALQPDDIAACVRLYGAPTATARTISGTVSNGASPLAGVSFCARPPTGVTCTASTGSGVYSCTVPNGWSGLLHAPGPAGLRIKPQSFSSVSANLTGQNPVVQAIGACNLDVDNNGLIEPATDGVAILRRMLGANSAGLSGLSGTCAANTTSAAIFNATTSNYNATGGSLTRPGTDGLVILRAMQGLTGTAVTNGLGLAFESGATNTTWSTIRTNFLNSTCGADFLP